MKIDRTAGENRKTHFMGIDLNTHLSIIGMSGRHKISQGGFEQYNKLGLMEVYGTLHPTIRDHRDTFFKLILICHVLDYKAMLNSEAAASQCSLTAMHLN